MLKALIHGKLSREQENMEDILTSNVFGALAYIPPQDGLFPFLGQAREHGKQKLGQVLDFSRLRLEKTEFWPYWSSETGKGCEPDVVFALVGEGGKRYLVLVEAKFRSGKSSVASDEFEFPVDQLAREWDNLVIRARAEKAEPYLIYLTADFALPLESVKEAVEEYSEKRRFGAPRIYWLSWTHLTAFVQRDEPVCRDLYAMLDRLGLKSFQGVYPPDGFPRRWTFTPPRLKFQWDIVTDVPDGLGWRFQQNFQNWLDRLPDIENIRWEFSR